MDLSYAIVFLSQLTDASNMIFLLCGQAAERLALPARRVEGSTDYASTL
jgi:hypothetical protein